jgi:hypothetical protein
MLLHKVVNSPHQWVLHNPARLETAFRHREAAQSDVALPAAIQQQLHGDIRFMRANPYVLSGSAPASNRVPSITFSLWSRV